MRRLTFGVLFLISVFASKAQYDSTMNEVSGEPRDLINLKVDFTNMVNPEDPSMLFSVEYFLKQDISINHEAGYVVDVNSEYEAANESFFGWKMRHELRWFFNNDESKNTRGYTSINFQYRYLAAEDRYTLGYECDEFGNCEYLKNFTGTIKTDRYVVQFRIGIQSHLSERLIFEVDGGFGYQNYMLRRSSINGGRFKEPNRYFTEDSFGTRPYLSVSGKLGFVLFKRSG